MCEFCTQHGEGEKWYLQARNYSREMLAQQDRIPYIEHFARYFEESSAKSIAQLDGIRRIGFAYRFVRFMAERQQKATHWGQVVPIEDVEQVIDLQDSIVRLPCVCRSLTTGREARYCFGLGSFPTDMARDYPDFASSFEVMDKQEAKRLLHTFDKQGFIHSVWTFKTPFIGGLCNCDQDCLAYRIQVKTNSLQTMFRAEYVGLVNWDQCNGCQKCLLHCQFGAIGFSHSAKKATIEPRQCYGCGVCRAVCGRDAIALKPRSEFAGLSW
ncbi:MAG: 4Fe-4S dicluster domain-containing protein [Anaerolineae bacterium]